MLTKDQLPALPSDYRWRIKIDWSDTPVLVLERREKSIFGREKWRKVGKSTMFPTIFRDMVKAAQNSADDILKKSHIKYSIDRAKDRDMAKEYEGVIS